MIKAGEMTSHTLWKRSGVIVFKRAFKDAFQRDRDRSVDRDLGILSEQSEARWNGVEEEFSRRYSVIKSGRKIDRKLLSFSLP